MTCSGYLSEVETRYSSILSKKTEVNEEDALSKSKRVILSPFGVLNTCPYWPTSVDTVKVL